MLAVDFRKGSTIFVVFVFCLALAGAMAGGEAVLAESDYLAGWEDYRFDFYGEVYALSETSLNELYGEDQWTDMTMFFADRKPEAAETYYSEDDLELLEAYRGETLSMDEILQLNDNFTLVAINAHRPFDPDTSHQRVRVDVSEVVSIGEGNILTNITAHNFMLSEEQLIHDSSMRVIPDGTGTIVYILPDLESEYINVELRSFLENEFLRRTVTIKQQ